MRRVQRGVPATLTLTVTVAGVPTDPTPDSATITITRADGTVLVAAADADDTGAGTFEYTLTPTDTALLDTLTIEWTYTVDDEETVTDHVEVVGGFLFSIDEARTLEPLDDDTKYPDAAIEAARTIAEQTLEDACGVAFVPRYRYRTLSASRDYTLPLWATDVTAIRSASIDGTALSEAGLDDLVIDAGYLTHSARWYPGPITVGYEHGRPYPPGQVTRAAILLARYYLVESPIDDRYTTVATEVGTFSLVTPGMRGAVTSIPEVNAIIGQFKTPSVA